LLQEKPKQEKNEKKKQKTKNKKQKMDNNIMRFSRPIEQLMLHQQTR
jgi:hypothetical protein